MNIISVIQIPTRITPTLTRSEGWPSILFWEATFLITYSTSHPSTFLYNRNNIKYFFIFGFVNQCLRWNKQLLYNRHFL